MEHTIISSLDLYAKIADMYDYMAQESPAFPPAGILYHITKPYLDRTIGQLLDVGIGTGRSSQPFAIESGLCVTGVDGSEHMLDLCAKKNIAQTLLRADFEHAALPFVAGEFDAAISVNTLYLLPPEAHRHILGEMSRVTRPGGLFAFNYEVNKHGEAGVRYNSATTDPKRPCKVLTYSMDPGYIRGVLGTLSSEILTQDTRRVETRFDGSPIVFETVVCRKPAPAI